METPAGLAIAELFAAPLAGRALNRGVQGITWGVLTAAWATSLVASVLAPGCYADGYAAVTLTVLSVPLVLAVGFWRSPDGPVRALQAFVVLGVAFRLADRWFVTQPLGDVGYPALGYALVTAVAVTGVVFRPLVGVPLVLVNCSVLFLERVRLVGVPQGIAELAGDLAAGLVSFVLVTTIREGLDRLAAAAADALDAQARAAIATTESDARRRLDGLIHDKVLAALALAGRGRVEDAAGLAEDAIKALTLDPPSPTTSPDPIGAVELIEDHARSLGLTLSLDSEAWPDTAAGAALCAATCEALTNVAKHAGVRDAAVSAYRRGEGFLVEVCDEGVGFDPSAIPPERLGVRERILGSLAAAGCQAHLESRRGQGTRLIMTTSEEAGVTEATIDGWLPHVMIRSAPLLALTLTGHLAAGFLHSSDGLLPWATTAAALAIPVCAVLLGVLADSSRWWLPAVVVTVLTWGGLIVNVADPSVSDWRWWFVGAFIPHVAIVSVRRGIRAALAIIGLAVALGIAGLAIRGSLTVGPLIESLFQCVASAVAFGWLRIVADRALQRTRTQLRARAAADVETAQSEALRAEIATRRLGLQAEVIPLLRSIASSAPLSDAGLAHCRAVEAATRDQLVASTLLTPDLVDAIGAARARGCRVAVTGHAEPGPGLRTFRAAAVALLRLGRARDRVTLRWAPDADGVLATCVLVGPDADALPLDGLGSLPHDSVWVSADTDSILVEIRDA